LKGSRMFSDFELGSFDRQPVYPQVFLEPLKAINASLYPAISPEQGQFRAGPGLDALEQKFRSKMRIFPF